MRAGMLGILATWGFVLGCSSPGSQRIVGPDGSVMAHVHCGSDQGTCFRLAGELCPSGYEIKPVLTGSDGNFLVSCRAAHHAATACAPATTKDTAQAWQPSTKPWPSTYPWPPPETSVAVQPTPKPVPTTPAAEIDLGY